MRFIFTLSTLLFLQISSIAQSAYVRGNTVFTEKDEMFRLYSVGSFSHPAFKIKSLNENDLILIDQTPLRNDQGTLLMKLNFISMPDVEAYIPQSVNMKKQIAKIIVNYNVVKNNQLNEDGVRLLCKNYGIETYPSKYISNDLTKSEPKQKNQSHLSQQPKKQESQQEEPKQIETPAPIETPLVENNSEEDIELEGGLVKRDNRQAIYLSGSRIRQDYKEIGSFKNENKTLLGQDGKQITILDVKGNEVAIARFINTDEQCELLTIKDYKTWNIPIPKGEIYEVVKSIVQVLVDKSYL